LVCLLAFILAAVLSSSCANLNLPKIDAEKIEYTRSGLYSSATVSAVNLVNTDTEVTADELNAQVTYPFVGAITIKVTKYRRQK